MGTRLSTKWKPNNIAPRLCPAHQYNTHNFAISYEMRTGCKIHIMKHFWENLKNQKKYTNKKIIRLTSQVYHNNNKNLESVWFDTSIDERKLHAAS